jgi:flagellar motor switch protein FliG
MNLTGPQRAAVVIAQLDDNRAQALLSTMSESEVVRLMSEVANLPSLTAEDVRIVMSAFTMETVAYHEVRQGGIELARRWLEGRLGPSRALEVVSELESLAAPQPLAFLNRMEPSQIAGFLAEEHPQTIALAVATIHHEHAARVLDRFDEEVAADIVRRIATMPPIPSVIVQRVSEALEERLSTVLRAGLGESQMGGVPAAAAVLNNVDWGAEKELLARLEAIDPELAEEIRDEMFVFDDVVKLDDLTLYTVLRSVALRDVAMSLKSADPEVVEKFMLCLSERAATDLVEEIQSLGPQRLSAIEAAQGALGRTVRELAESGAITLARANDEIIA